MIKDEILVLAGECGIKFKPLPRDLYCEIWSEQLESFYNAACKPLEDKIEQLKTVPMKYRRMAFNAQLQDENAELRRQLASAQLDNDQIRAELAALKEENATAWAQAHRLALELECLLLDTKDNAIVSKWWDSGMAALNEYQQLKPSAKGEAKVWTSFPELHSVD